MLLCEIGKREERLIRKRCQQRQSKIWSSIEVRTVRSINEFLHTLPLHAAILEPDLDLSFAQAQGVRDLDSPSSGQVSIKVKFFL